MVPRWLLYCGSPSMFILRAGTRPHPRPPIADPNGPRSQFRIFEPIGGLICLKAFKRSVEWPLLGLGQRVLPERRPRGKERRRSLQSAGNQLACHSQLPDRFAEYPEV